MSCKKIIIELLKSLGALLGLALFVLSVRWLLIEPFVIPSGSMIPSLLIRDHIVVNKLAYGIRYPFTKKYLWKRATPQRGDVVVFRSTQDRKFMIKRVLGLPGDSIVIDKTGQIWIDNKKLYRELEKEPQHSKEFYFISERSLGASYSTYDFFIEETEVHRYRVIQKKSVLYRQRTEPFVVPKDSVFVLGDNRDGSQDSRYFGFLPLENILGRAFGIWLSCEDDFFFSKICGPRTMRWKRMFQKIH